MEGLRLTQQTISPEQLAELCDVVYRIRLEQDCRNNVERMLAKDREADPYLIEKGYAGPFIGTDD